MKYKLKRDLPLRKAGDVGEKNGWDTPQGSTVSIKFECADLCGNFLEVFSSATFSDWFEEVDERWKPKEGEKFFYLNLSLFPSDEEWFNHPTDEMWYTIGNCFRTRELAEQAAEQIKALLKEFHKNNP